MSKDIRWGILGAAKFAREYMGPALQSAPGGHLAALATSAAEKAAPFQKFAPNLRLHSDYDALLADPEIDAVYIPLPNHLHLDWALKAMEAGKHVLVEKPITMAEAEFDQLIAKRDATGLLAAEAYMIVHHPQWQKAKSLLAEGAIGRLWRVDGAFSFNNRDMDNIRNKSESGGGLRDIGVYIFGSTRFVTGEEPSQLSADIRWENGVDVYAQINADFPSFKYSAFTSIRMHPRQEMVFHGEDGVITLRVPFNTTIFGEAQLELKRGTDLQVFRWPSTRQYELQVAAFNRSALDGGDYPCPLEFSRGTQRMIDMAFASAKKP